MKLVGLGKIAVGIVAGGGVAAIFSGSVLAASDTTASLPSGQEVRSATPATAATEEVRLDRREMASGAASAASPVQITQAEPASVAGSAKNGIGAGISSFGSITVEDYSPEAAHTTGGMTPKSPDGLKSKQALSEATDTGTGNVGSNGSDLSMTSGALPEQPAASAQAAFVPAGNSSTAPKGEMLLFARDSMEKVAYHTVILPVQPVITSRVVPIVEDLAASLPSAPEPARLPAPEKGFGLWSKLTMELARTLLPQQFDPHGDGGVVPGLMGSGFGGVLAVGSALAVFTFSYGLWLRRAGFVTAARSDSLTAGILTLFATPHLGYVNAPPRWHSPFLVVSEMKTSGRLEALTKGEEV